MVDKAPLQPEWIAVVAGELSASLWGLPAFILIRTFRRPSPSATVAAVVLLGWPRSTTTSDRPRGRS